MPVHVHRRTGSDRRAGVQMQFVPQAPEMKPRAVRRRMPPALARPGERKKRLHERA